MALTTVALLLAAAVFWQFRSAQALTESDFILLTDFVNTTGDSVFDGTLKQALAVKLEESPFLNVFPEQRVREALRLMNRSPDERVTGSVGREVCQRQNIKAMMTGEIAPLGSRYVLTLNAVNCQSGDSLAREQVEAASKEEVLSALGKAVSSLRGKLGESLSSIEKFDAPIEQATTSSLEALKSYSLGMEQWAKAGQVEALPFFRRATELDPNFALAYAKLGVLSGNLGRLGDMVEHTRKAFELRERVSEWERLYITSRYYHFVTGDLNKATDAYLLEKQTYPHRSPAYVNLSVIYAWTGQHEKELELAQQVMQMAPNHPISYGNLAGAYAALNRFDEAKAITEQKIERGLEEMWAHTDLYRIAFVQGDAAAMQQEVEWASGKSGEGWMIGLQAATAAFHGRLEECRGLIQRSVNLAQQIGFLEGAAERVALGALVEAEFGHRRRAREQAQAALAISRGMAAQVVAAWALARAGWPRRAGELTDDLARRYPTNTMVGSVYLPTIRAAIELSRRNPARALELLQRASPYELGGWPALPAYLDIWTRGEAYLQAGDGTRATAEFQKILDHRGIDPTSLYYALAHLGLARAHALAGDTAGARRAYQDFLALWKDADPDIPILQEAKAEYAKLR